MPMPASARFVRANVELITEDGEVVEIAVEDLYGAGVGGNIEFETNDAGSQIAVVTIHRGARH